MNFLKAASVFYKPRLLFIVLIAFNAGFPLGAQSEDAGETITGLVITGLRRTRLSTAERSLRKFIGLEASQVDPDEVRAAVMATGILEPLSVEIEGPVLSVAVREKWSIFPIPVVMGGSGGLMVGLGFFDANAFGLNDKFFLAGIYQSSGWLASAGYIHASPEGRVPGWSGFAVFSRQERQDHDQRGQDLRRFDLDTISISGGLNLPLLENTDLLSASAQFSFIQKTPRERENAFNGPEEDLRLFGASTELAIRKSAWDGYFLSQESASLRYTYRTTFAGFSFQSLGFRGAWEKSLVPGFRFILRTGLLYEPEAPILFESSPSAAQVAILPRGFSARSYAGLSAGLEKYLFRFSAGVLSLAAAYQMVYSEGSVLGSSFDHGLTGMLSFYLSQLAIPAVGLGAAYNVKENYFQGSFSLGMSF